MRPTDGQTLIADRLRARGVELTEEYRNVCGRGEDALLAWEAFCEVAAVPVDERDDELWGGVHVDREYADNDLLLHESGAGEGGFVVYFTRQLITVDDAGDYAGMLMLTLTVICERLPEGRVPEAQRWGYPGELEAWKQAVEASNSFRVMQELGPDRFRLTQD